MYDQLNVSLVSRGRLWGTWCLMRGDRSPVAGAHIRALMRQLVPHLARALRDAMTLDRALAPSAGGVHAGSGRARRAQSPVLFTAAAREWLADLADMGYEFDDGAAASLIAVVSLAARATERHARRASHARPRAVGARGTR